MLSAVVALRDEKGECSRTLVPRRYDEGSAFSERKIVLKSRFLASLEMTLATGFGVSGHSQSESRRTRSMGAVPRPSFTMAAVLLAFPAVVDQVFLARSCVKGYLDQISQLVGGSWILPPSSVPLFAVHVVIQTRREFLVT